MGSRPTRGAVRSVGGRGLVDHPGVCVALFENLPEHQILRPIVRAREKTQLLSRGAALGPGLRRTLRSSRSHRRGRLHLRGRALTAAATPKTEQRGEPEEAT
jgi:hypothetical protein